MTIQVIMDNIEFIIDYISGHLMFLNFILCITVVFFQRKEPTSVWAWLLILYFVPVLGFIIYLLAGTDMHKRKMFKVKEIEDKISEAIRYQEHSIRSKEMELMNPLIAKYSDLVYYNLESAGAVLTDDNGITIYKDGNEKFDALIEDIHNAKVSVHIEYYIIKEDVVFNRIKKVLLEKVKEGVEVRVLYDSMGCRRFPKKVFRELEKEGIRIAEFFPAFLKRFHLRLNYRNHRKIAVIDGKIGYVGGFNIGKEYIGLDKKFGYWRDTHLRVEGTAVTALQIRFILDWNYAAKENLFQEDKYFELPEESAGNCDVQIISSGPDSSLQNIRNNYLRLIAKAEKSIYIQSPYFVPDEAVLNALIIAAYSGIDIHIMIPCKPDHPFVYWATYSYIGDLVLAGAKCYIYNNGFLHCKGMIVDDSVLCYGTANMDIRSFRLNFEVNAIVYNSEKAVEMRHIFEEDLKKSTQVTRDIYNSRALIIRIKEQFSRLLSPVL